MINVLWILAFYFTHNITSVFNRFFGHFSNVAIKERSDDSEMLSFMRMIKAYHSEDEEPLGTLSREGGHCISFVTQNTQFS